MRPVAGLCAVLALSSAAWAADLDEAAKKRVRDLVAQCASRTEKTRRAAETALAAMGLDAVPAAVAAAEKLKQDDASWASFSRAIGGMGAAAVGAVQRLRPSWPKGTEPRFERLLDDARAVAGAAALAALPASPPEVVAKIDAVVAELSARPSFAHSDPKIESISALGRPAFGECVRILRDRRAAGVPGVEDYKARVIAKLALVKIVAAEDVPLFAALVRGGAADAAYPLRDVAAPEAGAVFADAVRIGIDHHRCFAIEKRGPDERVGRALATWISAQDDYEKYLVGSAALAAGRAGGAQASQAIQAYLGKTNDASVLVKCHLGLARLGEARGIAGLADFLERSADSETGNIAGNGLNEVSGRSDFKGRYDSAAKGWRGNFAEAAKAYRTWWEAAKDKAKFDASTGKWTF